MIWPVVEAQYVKMLKRGAGDSLTEEQMLSNLLHGSYYMMVAYQDERIVGSCIFQLLKRAKGLCIEIVGIAGEDVFAWAEAMHKEMDKVVKETGAYCVETLARPATREWLLTQGWRQKAILMEKTYGRL